MIRVKRLAAGTLNSEIRPLDFESNGLSASQRGVWGNVFTTTSLISSPL